MHFRTEPLRSVMQCDALKLASSLGVLEEFRTKTTFCSNCGNLVDFGSLFAIYPDSDNLIVRFVCGRPRCIRWFSLYIQRNDLL